MAEIAIAILASDSDQRAQLQTLADGSAMARTVHSGNNLPVVATDPALRRVRDAGAEVIVVDIPASAPEPALRAIELLHQELPGCTIFAVGTLSEPQVIVSAMRSGAREFLPRPTAPSHVLEALVRLRSVQRKGNGSHGRGKIFAFMNAKGGCGATTLAVNLATQLQATHGRVALVDMALLGHAALYLDVKPAFTVYDALRNLHRLDIALLESFVTPARSGLNLLAGTVEPQAAGGSAPEFAKLFDLLVNAYSHVVVDLSTRQDAVARTVAGLSDLVLLVAQTDVASLWSAGHLYQRFLEAETRERVRLILNRFRRMPGFRDSDAEIASGAKLLAKIPNNYALVAGAVDRGLPLVTENHSDVARAMADLATALVHPEENRSKTFSLFRRAV